MRIKEIDFVNEQGDRDDYFCTELPTGQYATVEMVSEDIGFGEQWNWEISVGEYTKECGTGESKDLAIKACQAAWEKMVMEAFEPEEGCEYCRNRTLLEVEHDLALWIGESTLYIRHIPFYERECEIDYCPMCGRKL